MLSKEMTFALIDYCNNNRCEDCDYNYCVETPMDGNCPIIEAILHTDCCKECKHSEEDCEKCPLTEYRRIAVDDDEEED